MCVLGWPRDSPVTLGVGVGNLTSVFSFAPFLRRGWVSSTVSGGLGDLLSPHLHPISYRPLDRTS